MWHADEQEWMWDLFPGKYALCRVFALLYGIKTWRGSVRKLAAIVRVPEATVRHALNELIERGFLQLIGDNYKCVYIPQQCATNTQKCATIAPLPPTPPITKNNIKEIKEMKNNEKMARETIATPDPQDLFSFSELLSAYRLRAGDYQIAPAILSDARGIWGAYPEWKRQLLLAQLRKPEGWVRPRLDWTLTAFDPQPTDYNGARSFPDEPLVIATYREIGGIYTEREAKLFGMNIIKPFKP